MTLFHAGKCRSMAVTSTELIWPLNALLHGASCMIQNEYVPPFLYFFPYLNDVSTVLAFM